MWPGGPIRVFLPVTSGAPCAHLLDVIRLQSNLFRDTAAQVGGQTTNILPMKTGVYSENVTMTIGTQHVTVGGGVPIGVRLPDFMAAGAGASAGVAVINTGAGQKQSRTEE